MITFFVFRYIFFLSAAPAVPFVLCTFSFLSFCSHFFSAFTQSLNWKSSIETQYRHTVQTFRTVIAFVDHDSFVEIEESNSFRFSLFKVCNFISQSLCNDLFFLLLFVYVIFSVGESVSDNVENRLCLGYPNVFQDMETVVHFVNINKPPNCINKFEEKKILLFIQFSLSTFVFSFNLQFIDRYMNSIRNLCANLYGELFFVPFRSD